MHYPICYVTIHGTRLTLLCLLLPKELRWLVELVSLTVACSALWLVDLKEGPTLRSLVLAHRARWTCVALHAASAASVAPAALYRRGRVTSGDLFRCPPTLNL